MSMRDVKNGIIQKNLPELLQIITDPSGAAIWFRVNNYIADTHVDYINSQGSPILKRHELLKALQSVDNGWDGLLRFLEEHHAVSLKTKLINDLYGLNTGRSIF